MLEALLGAPSPNSLSDVHAAVAAILGPEGNQVSLATMLDALTANGLADLLTLQNAVVAIRGASNTNLGQLLSEDGFVNGMSQVMSKLLDLEERLDHIQAALGATPYNSLEIASVRGILWSLYQCCQQQGTGLPPDGVTDFCSSSSLSIDGLRYAVFTGPIEGVTLNESGTTLDGSFDGWSYYIQTTDPEPKVSGDPSAPQTWNTVTGSPTLYFTVAPQYSIKVCLRRAVVQECVLLESSSWGTNQFGAWYGLTWSPAYASTPYTLVGLTFYELVNGGEFDGYTMHPVSYTDVVYMSPDRGTNYSTGWPKTIGTGEQVTVYSQAPFSLYFCPPGIEPPPS